MISRPSIEDFAHLSDGAYSVEELLQFELKMFKTLDYDLSQPYALQFLRRLGSAKKAALEVHVYTGAKYLIELSILGKATFVLYLTNKKF